MPVVNFTNFTDVTVFEYNAIQKIENLVGNPNGEDLFWVYLKNVTTSTLAQFVQSKFIYSEEEYNSFRADDYVSIVWKFYMDQHFMINPAFIQEEKERVQSLMELQQEFSLDDWSEPSPLPTWSEPSPLPTWLTIERDDFYANRRNEDENEDPIITEIIEVEDDIENENENENEQTTLEWSQLFNFEVFQQLGTNTNTNNYQEQEQHVLELNPFNIDLFPNNEDEEDEDEDEEKIQCPICYEQIPKKTQCYLQCNSSHCFCVSCLTQQIQTSMDIYTERHIIIQPKCALCRVNIESIRWNSREVEEELINVLL